MRLQSSGISLNVKFFKVRHKTLGREIICTEMLVWARSILDRSDKELLAEFYRHLAEGPTAQNWWRHSLVHCSPGSQRISQL